MTNPGGTNRRDFLKTCLVGAAALSARGPLAQAQDAGEKSRVVVARDGNVFAADGTLDQERALNLLDRAMEAMYQLGDPVAAWKKVVQPGDRVSLKVNVLGGKGLRTNPVLVDAICERLQQAGIRGGDIIIWDRDTAELGRNGFHVSDDPNKVRCLGTDRFGFEDDLATHGSVGSRLSKILTRECNVMINLPVLKDHELAGVTVALKNMYGVIHNPNKYHPNGGCPFIADLNMLPEIRGKMRLVICDATTAGYEGGPGYKPQYAWRANSILVARDPVALDQTAWQIIERKRAEKGLKSLEEEKRAPRHIANAADAQHRLGANDPSRINLVEVVAG